MKKENSLFGATILPKVRLSPKPVHFGIISKGERESQCACACDCACFINHTPPLPALSSPISCYLELTPACNNHCPGCGNVFATAGQPLRQEMFTDAVLSLDQWRVILAKLQPYIYRLKLTGGEPTLHPDFEEIVSIVEKLAIPFVVFSNGRWHNPNRLLSFLKAKSTFEGFLISLHGATAQAHEAFSCTPGSFKETLQNIRGATDANLSVSISTILTQHNFNQIEEIVTFHERLGVQNTVFNRYLGTEIPGISLEGKKLKEALQAIDALKQAGARVKIGNCVPQCFCLSSSTGCLAGTAFCTVDPWGNVRPCNHAPLICGNLLNQTVEEVWRSEGMEHWRGLIPSQCYQCSEFSQCQAGCRAEAMLFGAERDPLMCDPLIWQQPEATPKELLLYELARPVGQFDLRPESFGYILIYGNHVLPVPLWTKGIWEALDGQITLKEIQQQFGAEGLSLVTFAVQQSFVQLYD